MAGQEPEEQVHWPASRQQWRRMSFLHWPYQPDQLRHLLAPGLELDLWEGTAWLSVTPFLMADFRIGSLPPVPMLSTFPETNVRTYVRGPNGRDGLWFLSLEADSLATVLAASTVYGVPYRWADMAVDEGSAVRYRSHRRRSPSVGHDISVRPGAPCEAPSGLDHWLTGRWRAYTTIGGRLAWAPVQHEPWPLWEATVVNLEESLLMAEGVPEPDGDPLVHFSPGVFDVRLGPPRFL